MVLSSLSMWIVLAFLSAFFAGITSILAKCGIRKTDSAVATAFRTIIILAFSWLMAAIGGPLPPLGSIAPATWIFLILSGLATGASWLCYFRALKDGDVSKVVPIDKSSTVLTILLPEMAEGEYTLSVTTQFRRGGTLKQPRTYVFPVVLVVAGDTESGTDSPGTI